MGGFVAFATEASLVFLMTLYLQKVLLHRDPLGMAPGGGNPNIDDLAQADSEMVPPPVIPRARLLQVLGRLVLSTSTTQGPAGP
jgi:hypothetical protein